jgi:hypothetical protein
VEIRELTATRAETSFNFNVRALQPTTPFWVAMYVASGLGTNLGDLYAQYFNLGLVASFFRTMIVSVGLIFADLKNRAKTEIFFWTAIVLFRAGATNVADFLTHNLHQSYAIASFVLAVATIAVGAVTRPGPGGASPMIDLRYWCAMFLAGVFGTIFGDLVGHALTVRRVPCARRNPCHCHLCPLTLRSHRNHRLLDYRPCRAGGRHSARRLARFKTWARTRFADRKHDHDGTPSCVAGMAASSDGEVSRDSRLDSCERWWNPMGLELGRACSVVEANRRQCLRGMSSISVPTSFRGESKLDQGLSLSAMRPTARGKERESSKARKHHAPR